MEPRFKQGMSKNNRLLLSCQHLTKSHSSYLSLIILSLIILSSSSLIPPTEAFFIDNNQSPQQHQWSYRDQHHWAPDYKHCGSNAQSPIDIQSRNVISNSHLNLQFFNYDQPVKFKLSNAHHTIKLNPIESFMDPSSQFGVKFPAPSGSESNDNRESSAGTQVPDIITADEPPNDEDHGYHSSGTGSESSSSQSHKSQSRFSGSRLQFNTPSQQPVDSLYGNQIEQDNSSGNSQGGGAANQLPYNGAPTIKLDWLDDGNNEFRLQDVHFHWGERRDNGSEHAIDGNRAAMEVSDICSFLILVLCLCKTNNLSNFQTLLRGRESPCINRPNNRKTNLNSNFSPLIGTRPPVGTKNMPTHAFYSPSCAHKIARCTWFTSSMDSTNLKLASPQTR